MPVKKTPANEEFDLEERLQQRMKERRRSETDKKRMAGLRTLYKDTHPGATEIEAVQQTREFEQAGKEARTRKREEWERIFRDMHGINPEDTPEISAKGRLPSGLEQKYIRTIPEKPRLPTVPGPAPAPTVEELLARIKELERVIILLNNENMALKTENQELKQG